MDIFCRRISSLRNGLMINVLISKSKRKWRNNF